MISDQPTPSEHSILRSTKALMKSSISIFVIIVLLLVVFAQFLYFTSQLRSLQTTINLFPRIIVVDYPNLVLQAKSAGITDDIRIQKSITDIVLLFKQENFLILNSSATASVPESYQLTIDDLLSHIESSK